MLVILYVGSSADPPRISADAPRISADGDGKDVSAPVEDVLNKNPSLSLSGSSPQRTRERRALRTHLRPHLHRSLWPSGGTCGRLWAPFGSLWGTLGLPLAVLWDPFGYLGPPFGSLWGALGLPLAVLWGPFGHRGAKRPALGPGPGQARPALGPVRKNLRKH